MDTGLAWLLRAGEQRPSRFHDYESRPVSIVGVTDLPIVLWQSVLRRLRGQRPVLPWIPYPAIRRLADIIQPQWRVLEMGSGNSTLWLAKRVRQIRSVESDQNWYEQVWIGLMRLSAVVQYEYVDVGLEPERYWRLRPGEQQSYDFVLVDGLYREQCVDTALQAVRRGGYVYLDNVDTSGRAAFPLLRQAVTARGGSLEVLTGFPPAQPTVTTGALARL